MAKKRKSGNFSHHGGVRLDFYGFEELAQKIVDAGGGIEDALGKATIASSKPIERDLYNFVASEHLRSGEARDSFKNIFNVERTGGGGIIRYELGFDKNEGGLHALYLDVGTKVYGTPRVKPTFFVYYAFKNNADNVVREQEKALQDLLKGLL